MFMDQVAKVGTLIKISLPKTNYPFPRSQQQTDRETTTASIQKFHFLDTPADHLLILPFP